MIFNAEDLSLEAHVTGTDLVLFGSDAKFFPRHIGAPAEATSASPEMTATPPADSATSLHANALGVAALCSIALRYLHVM